MGILDLPDDLKQRLRDGIVDLVVDLAEKVPGGDKMARVIRQLSSEAAFYNSFDQAVVSALQRFRTEYTAHDEDLVEAITTSGEFWRSKHVQQALIELIRRPGAWLVDERETVVQHFADVLPKRVNRERVDKAVSYFLHCVLEELWTLPGVSEIREIYSLQFQKIGAEAARQQVALLEAQLQATSQLSTDVRQALLQLATILEQRLLAAPLPQPTLPNTRPAHNLFQPEYARFVGRQKELDWLRQRLSPSDRAWQVVITGIGGVGKSALALALAHDFREHYQALPVEERFEAIIWFSAKEEILTVEGREKSALSGLIFRTLEDIYTTIAQTLEREEITRAVPEDQDHLAQKALSAQRTLLIVDNLESVTDERVRTFLYKLPPSTKCIITSREWIDVAVVLKLTGLPSDEADLLISEEAATREVKLKTVERQHLFNRTSGLPLPIKLSVARLSSGETFDQVMRWLGDAAGDLPYYCVKGQMTMSRERDPNAWKLLLACSLFDRDAGASREALGFITDLSRADRDDGLTLLQRLSLLNRDEDDRFWILPMVQGYAGAELGKTDVSEALTRRWLQWFLQFVQSYVIDLEFHIERAQKVGPEYPNLLNALRWCREHERWEILIQLAEEIWFYPYIVDLFGELREVLEAALQATKVLQDEQRQERFLVRLAELFWTQGQYQQALEVCEKIEEIALRYKEEAPLGWVAEIRSDILTQQGHLLEAEGVARAMLEIGERLNNLEMKLWAVYRLAKIEANKHQYEQALEWLEKGERWSRDIGYVRGLAWMMYRRGTTLVLLGDAITAESCLMQSLNMGMLWKEGNLIAHNKLSLAQVYVDIHRLQLARQLAEEARDLFERLGMPIELAQAEKLLGTLPGKNSYQSAPKEGV